MTHHNSSLTALLSALEVGDGVEPVRELARWVASRADRT